MVDKVKVQNEIDFLSELERGEIVTQMSLARRISVSVGLINALIKRAIKKGYVKAKAAPYKRYVYYITPHGFREKSRLVSEYLETSLDFFRAARQEYVALFSRSKSCGMNQVSLAGRGELVEIAHLAAREVGVEIVGLYDKETNLDHVDGIPVVRTMAALEAADSVVVVESRMPQEMFDELREYVEADKILAPAFLHITREPLDFTPPNVAPKGALK